MMLKSISPNIKKNGQNHQVKGLFHQDNPLSKYGSGLADKTPSNYCSCRRKLKAAVKFPTAATTGEMRYGMAPIQING